ncbi:MAG: germination protein YpeB, partial [Oscillospiraceae bacterium]|nr:germination protein YpeB [Oscillospiraceae bacterium]
ETVTAVDALSDALAKSVYATDGGMCARICGEAYANALAAESALSILPFSTQELEQISGFLNLAGDYAYSLCGTAADGGFTAEQVEILSGMADVASGLVDSLLELQGGVHAGDVVMDRVPLRLQNVGEEDGEVLSARLLAYEASFAAPDTPEYDGKYGCAQRETRGYLTEDAMLALAAEYAGVPQAALQETYAYEGTNGRRCYRTGDLFLCVSRCGVESMVQSRLVGEALLDAAQARQIAEDFLAARGFRDLALTAAETRGAVSSMVFSRIENDAVCVDNRVQIAIALDDGSIYAFNAADYCGEASGAHFSVDENTAAQALPEGLTPVGSRKVILKSPGKRDLACYEFTCADDAGRQVRISVDAATGRQFRIEL